MKNLLILLILNTTLFAQDQLKELNQRVDSLNSQKKELLSDINNLKSNERNKRSKTVSIYGEYQYLMQQTNFTSIDDINFINCCNENFSANNSLGYELGIKSDFINFNQFTFGIGIGYNTIKSELNSLEIINYSDNGDLEQIHVNHYLDYNLGFINIRPTLFYNLSKSLSVSLNPSIRYGISASAEQKSIMNETNTEGVLHGLSFGDNINGIQYIRNDKSGNISNMTPLILGITPGITYNYYINNRYSLSANLNYNYSLNTFSDNKDWKTDHFALGFSVNYNYSSLNSELDPETLEKLVDEIDKQLESLNESIREINLKREFSKDIIKFDQIEITKVLNSGNIEKFESIEVYEKKYDLTTPILNYIFFNKNSEEIPRRYISKIVDRKERFNFDESQLANETLLEINHNILNIIGSRMLKFPDAKLKIIAYNDGSDEEISNQISYKRSLVVKSILKNTFGIPDRNFVLEHKDLPLNPTDINKSYGAEENRRVEFISTDPRLLSPILFKNKVKREIDITDIEIKINFTVGAGVSQIYGFVENYNSENNPHVELEFTDVNYEYALAKLDIKNIWNPIELVDDLYLEVQMASNNNELARINEVVNIPVKTINKNSGIYYKEFYIYMPYRENENLIDSDIIVKYIKDNYNSEDYQIEVTGYTDKTGLEEFNEKLSQERSQKVVEALNLDAESINGGEINIDNELPEGRFLNRRVKILIKQK